MFKNLLILLIGIFFLTACTQVSDAVDEEGREVGEATVTADEEGIETTIHIETVEKGGAGEACEWDGQCKSETEVLACIDGICTSVDCKYSSDCPEGTALCMTNKCLTKAEVEERFKTWTLSTMCPECLNCNGSGKRGMLQGKDNQEFQICYDCNVNTDCKEGYRCEVGRCVQ